VVAATGLAPPTLVYPPSLYRSGYLAKRPYRPWLLAIMIGRAFCRTRQADQRPSGNEMNQDQARTLLPSRVVNDVRGDSGGSYRVPARSIVEVLVVRAVVGAVGR
jgi:hypothetical protein